MRYHINRRVKRNLRHNLSFYLSASLLTAISVFLMIALYSAVEMMDTDFSRIHQEGNVEEAQFTTMKPITEEEITQLDDLFHAELEKMEYRDYECDGYTLRVMKETYQINRYQLLEGDEPQRENEILVNRDFMISNDLKIGDELTIEGNQYTITGMAVRPDYLYPQKELSDFYVDKSAFGQVILKEEEFRKLSDTQSYYSIIYHEDNSKEVRNYLMEHYLCLSYLDASGNNRIEMSKGYMDEVELMIGGIMPVFFLINVIIVAVVLGRMVQKERKQIGTLLAFGYSKKEVVRHYSIYAAIPGIIGSLTGILFAFLCLKKVILFFAMDFETINYEPVFHIPSMIAGFLLPTLLYQMTGYIVVQRLLRTSVVSLLAGSKQSSSQRTRRLFATSKLSFRSKYRLRSILLHKSRTFVVILGIVSGAFLCGLSFMLLDSCDYMIEQGMDAAGNYEYQYWLNGIQTQKDTEGEPMLSMVFEVDGYRTGIQLTGIVAQPEYLDMKTTSGKPMEYGKYYMTTNAAALYGVQAGDSFTILHPLTLERTTITIADVIEDNLQCSLYTSLEQASKVLGVENGSYNIVLSDHELTLDPKQVYRTITKESLREQFRYTIDMMYQVLGLLIGFGILLCIISIYLTVNMLVQENAVNISMLKVLGYRNPEINRMVLNTNHILVPIGFLIGIVLCRWMCELIFQNFIAELNVYLKPVIHVDSILVSFAILAGSYFVSLCMLKRKVLRIDMVDSLKDNRE